LVLSISCSRKFAARWLNAASTLPIFDILYSRTDLFAAVIDTAWWLTISMHCLRSDLINLILAAYGTYLELGIEIWAAAQKATIIVCFACELVGEFEVSFLMKGLTCYKHILISYALNNIKTNDLSSQKDFNYFLLLSFYVNLQLTIILAIILYFPKMALRVEILIFISHAELQ
jgi:hypothetical protein